MQPQPKIVVVGSVNMDIVNTVAAFPQPGETVKARKTTFNGGGKGANQAVAAAAAGGAVDFIGAVGNDAFAEPLAAGLAEHGVGIEALSHKQTTSGQAFIAIDSKGENTIILSAGANGQITPAEVMATREVIAHADAVLTQNEIPWEASLAAMTLAHAVGVRVIVNPAPATPLPAEVYPLIDTLIVNETEAATLLGRHIESADEVAAAAVELVERGARAVILTIGARGSYYADRDGQRIETPAFPVDVVDTTGAGDTFIGMYAVATSQMSVREALRFASAASAIAATRPGAQPSIPRRAEVEAFLARMAQN